MTNRPNVTPLRPRVAEQAPAVPNCQRALWTFLISTLAAPFLAAVIILLASIISGRIGRGPASLLALDFAGQMAWSAQKAVETYVWSALPAGIAGAGAAGIVYARGTVSWLWAASLAAVVASVLAFLAGGMFAQHVTPIAFIAAITGIAMRFVLKRGRIIT